MRRCFRCCVGTLLTYFGVHFVLLHLFLNVFTNNDNSKLSIRCENTLSTISDRENGNNFSVFSRNFSQETEEIYYQKREFVVEPYPYDIMIKPLRSCLANTSVVIMVHSFHTKVDTRMAIRSTWGSVAKNSMPYWPSLGYLNRTFMLYFVLGLHQDEGLNDLIVEENEIYGDIVLGNFHDSYANMTLKSLLGLKFIINFCRSPRIMIKSDDDMFLNLPAMLNILENIPQKRFMVGPLCVGSKVYRKGKWKLTREEFPFDCYPPYYAGSAYIISRYLWQELFDLSFYVPRIHIDDVYITGILGKILNATYVKRDGFAFWNSKAAKACDIKTSEVLTSTRMKPEDMRRIWNHLGNVKENCPCS